MKEIDISDESLEDLLAYDDLFLDYFNAFLCLPAFPQPLEYDRLSGSFEEVPVAARQPGDGVSVASGLAASAAVVRYGATDAERESQLSWARTERLPFFVRTPLFRELKLVKLLLRRLDDRRSGSSRRAPRGDSSSSHIRGYSRQTGTYASSLSNSGDNSNAADGGAGYDDDDGDEDYDDRWNEDENDSGGGGGATAAAAPSRPASLPPRLGLATDDSAAAEKKRVTVADRKRIAKRAEGIVDEGDYDESARANERKSGDDENVGDSSIYASSTGNKRSLSAPVNYREFLRMPMYADFDDIFMGEESDYDGHPYLAYADGREVSDDQTETDVRALEGETRMTMQQMKEKALAKRSDVSAFRRFLRDTPALALLEFWLECENFKDRMEDFDDVQNMAMRNQLFRDIQDKYKMSLTDEAKRQISQAASSYQLSHAVFIRTQYDVLRRLRSYWVPRYILHREKTQTLAALLGEPKASVTLPDGGEKYCASFLPAVSVVGSLPVRHDQILDLTRTATWPKVSRALSGRVRSGRRYSRDGAGLAEMLGPSLRDMMLVSLAADVTAGGPFANYLSSEKSTEPQLHASLLFLDAVAEYGKAEDRVADRLLRMNRAWSVFNVFLADGCQHKIAVSAETCDAVHRVLLASSDFVEASVFDDAKNGVTAELERPWVDFLRDDTRRFWECSKVRSGGDRKGLDDVAVGDIEVLVLRDYPRIVVRRPPTVKFPKLRLDSRATGRRAAPILYLSDAEREERRRIAHEKRRELQKEQRRVLREFRRRKEAETRRVLIDLNARKAGQQNAAGAGSDGSRGKSGGGGTDDERDDEDGYYSRRSGARTSTVHDGSRGVGGGRRSTSKELPVPDRTITFRDFAGNRPIMTMFKKYLNENDIKDQANMVSLFNEIEAYTQLDAKPHLKRDMQSTFLYKTYMDRHSKKAVPLPDRFYARLTGHERDCPRTPTLLDVQRHVAGELDALFRQFFEHQADAFGVDTQTLASMTHAELSLRSETDAALSKAYARKPGGKNKKTGKAPPTKEDKAEFLAELGRCQVNGGRPTVTMMYFQKYLAKHSSDDENGSHAERDLAFYLEVQKFKDLTHAFSDDELVRRKVLAIVDCFLESPISPACQIDISQDLCAKMTKAALRYGQGKDQAAALLGAAVGAAQPGQGHSPMALFDEAHVAVFKELLPYWAGFCKQYKPSENAEETPMTKHQKELRRRYEDFVNAQAPAEQRLTLPAIVDIVAKASALSYSLTEGLKPAKGYDFEDVDHHHAHTLPRPDSEASNAGGRLAALKGAAAAHHGSRKNLVLQGIKETEA